MIHRKLRLAYVHLPKCGGSSMVHWLQHTDSQWIPLKNNRAYRTAYDIVHRSIANQSYRVFTVVRHPATRCISGYYWIKNYCGLSMSFDQYLDWLSNPILVMQNIGWTTDQDHKNHLVNLWWHCGIGQIQHGALRADLRFRLEDTDSVEQFLSQYYPDISTMTHTNHARRSPLTITDTHWNIMTELFESEALQLGYTWNRSVVDDYVSL